MEFTGETKTSLLSDAVTIQNGMGESPEAFDLTALDVDSIVRIVLDESEQVISISFTPARK